MYWHTKNGKVQVVPLCSKMVSILREYMTIRKGESEEYLFCNQYGEMLSENALRLAIAHYNRSRGVEKTSIHLFRHTFARKYLVDCGGDAFMLQKLLGHASIKTTMDRYVHVTTETLDQAVQQFQSNRAFGI